MILRARDPKLVERFLTRGRLTTLGDSQLRNLYEAGKTALNESIVHVRNCPKQREHEDEWWERRLQFATVLLARLTPRLAEREIDAIAKMALPLSGYPAIWERVSVMRELGTFLERVASCVSTSTLVDMLPQLVELPVPGSSQFERKRSIVGDWYDPVTAVERIDEAPNLKLSNAQIDHMIRSVAKCQGEGRKNATLRVVSLWSKGHLNRVQTSAFRDALFRRRDDDGFPEDTGCYDSLILGLPRQNDVDEAELYRKRYLDSTRSEGLNFWANLARSVDRFTKGRQRRRSIAWTGAELSRLLARTTNWIEMVKGCQEETDRLRQDRRWFFASFHSGEERTIRQGVREWLNFIEEGVLLSPRLNDAISEQCLGMLCRADEIGICTLKVTATQYVMGIVSEADAIQSIRNGFCSKDNDSVWQACCALVRWGELSTQYEIALPQELSLLLGSVIAIRRHEQLPLLLNIAGELIVATGGQVPNQLMRDVLTALEHLLVETDYATESCFSVEKRIHLRTICIKLARVLRQYAIDHSCLSSWLALVNEDIFAEVRRS